MVLNLLNHSTILCFYVANEKQWHVGASLYGLVRADLNFQIEC